MAVADQLLGDVRLGIHRLLPVEFVVSPRREPRTGVAAEHQPDCRIP
jgi:hypothetical protein